MSTSDVSFSLLCDQFYHICEMIFSYLDNSALVKMYHVNKATRGLATAYLKKLSSDEWCDLSARESMCVDFFKHFKDYICWTKPNVYLHLNYELITCYQSFVDWKLVFRIHPDFYKNSIFMRNNARYILPETFDKWPLTFYYINVFANSVNEFKTQAEVLRRTGSLDQLPDSFLDSINWTIFAIYMRDKLNGKLRDFFCNCECDLNTFITNIKNMETTLQTCFYNGSDLSLLNLMLSTDCNNCK